MNFPQNPFLQLTLPRVQGALTRLHSKLWENPVPVEVSFAGAQRDAIPFSEARVRAFQPVSLPFTWGKLFETGWFHVKFPEADTADRPRFLHWQDQGEGTLFLEETPYYGFDVAHRHVRLPDDVREGWIESLCLQSAIWHHEATGTTPEGSRLDTVRVVHRNEWVWRAIHDLEVLRDLAKAEAVPSLEFQGLREMGEGYRAPTEVVSVLLRRLLRLLDDAVNTLDKQGPEAMVKLLESARPLLQQSPTPIRAILTGHAHIDLVWLWPERCAEYKARHTFASMNRLMEEYPEFRFAYSQSASYEAVGKSCPAMLEQVKKRVKQGTWEAVGATYVEMDTLMACGEALARAFLVGQESFRELFGESSKTLWIPDVFGYAGCLPQIMRQCGVENFFTTKLTWSCINRFPYSSFIWRGTDGSEVTTHVTQGMGYNQGATPSEALLGARAYIQSDVHDAYLQPTGFGDGGGGVTPEMCERARRMESLTGVPKVQWGRIDDFFADLNGVREKLPHYQGELYLEYHRGTFTTHGDLKASFRRLERALQLQEAAHVLAGAGPIPVHAWKRLIFSQFHDYIPGSSIWEVYKEGLPELNALAEEALAAAAKTLAASETDAPAIFNTLPLPRPMIVDRNGTPERVVLPPLTAVATDQLAGRPLASSPSWDGTTLQSERVQARFNNYGEVEELTIDGHAVSIRAPLNQFSLYPDYPNKYPAWDIDRQTLCLGERLTTPAEIVDAPVSTGTAGVRFRRRISENSSMTVLYKVDARHAMLEVELEIDWNDPDHLLKAGFPTNYQGQNARFGAPFNSVFRSQQPGSTEDEAKYEGCASRWAMVTDDAQSEGFHLVTEAKYGMNARDGVLGLSLVRSPTVTGEDSHRKMFPEANRPLSPRNKHSDLGTHVIRYALGRSHANLTREDHPAAMADLLYTPMLPAQTTGGSGLRGLSGGESLIPAWAKPADTAGSWILRLHETMGRAGTLDLDLEPGWKAERTTLAEDKGQPVDGARISFRPYEIVSIRMMPPNG
ncbi:MAG: alpha-mannosidase [Verrucomicrobia bacterium]|nr:alpha-mannosidase [Verrucomicrobiota bacterium]MCH8514249.1 glycosyl hydrolase-related protein [Kiritimatiellia bacterium]